MMTVEQRDEFLGTLFNPRYVYSDSIWPIVLDGVFNGVIMQFYASPQDPMRYGRRVYANALAGEYGEILKAEAA